MEKSLLTVWLGISWVRQSLRGSQGRANSISWFNGVSDMALACWLWGSVGEGFSKRIMASAFLYV